MILEVASLTCRSAPDAVDMPQSLPGPAVDSQCRLSPADVLSTGA